MGRAAKIRDTGIQRIRALRHVIILAGAGVGGGSLAYANTLTASRSALRLPVTGRA